MYFIDIIDSLLNLTKLFIADTTNKFILFQIYYTYCSETSKNMNVFIPEIIQSL